MLEKVREENEPIKPMAYNKSLINLAFIRSIRKVYEIL